MDRVEYKKSGINASQEGESDKCEEDCLLYYYSLQGLI